MTTDLPADRSNIHEFKRVGVVGSGTMGRGIAAALLRGGPEVYLHDADPATLDRAVASLPGLFSSQLVKGRMTQGDLAERLSRLRLASKIKDLAECDLVVEAIIEDLPAKRTLFAKLDKLCGHRTILATNTSTLDVAQIGKHVPERQVIGLHFFSPAHVMKLVEVVRLPHGDQDSILAVRDLLQRCGKVPVDVANGPSFVANRMLHRRLREAVLLVEEGAEPQDVDRVMRQFGFPLGPFEIADLAGVDVGWRAREQQRAAVSKLAVPPSWLDAVAALGRYGQKTGLGVYRYENDSRIPIEDPELRRIIDLEVGHSTARDEPIPDEVIVQRLMYVIVNEGAQILEERIADTASDIDTIWRLGFGFPAALTGPMAWADAVGLMQIQRSCQNQHSQTGASAWKPATLLTDLAMNGGTFYRHKSGQTSLGSR